MTAMKKYFALIITIFILSCAAPKKQETAAPKEEKKDIIVKTLNDFFLRCEEDIRRAKKVVLDHDLVKNLTHLKYMNYGGRKYYLLERESITDMINAVTVGIYADYILINKGGDVIYTRVNDTIFGKNVRTSLAKSPLKTCYEERDIPIFFHDLAQLNKTEGDYYIFVSVKAKGGNTNPGIFILQFDVRKLREVLDENTDIIGIDGTYKLTQKNIEPGTAYPLFSSINMEHKDTEDLHTFTSPAGKPVSYRFFKHGTIHWILVREK